MNSKRIAVRQYMLEKMLGSRSEFGGVRVIELTFKYS